MKKIKKIKKERKLLRREFGPVFLAIFVLGFLIVGLIYMIKRKPNIDTNISLENTLAVEEITVGSSTDYCKEYNIDDMRREANKVVLTYGIEENVVIGQSEDTDNDPDAKEPVLIDMYGDALLVNIHYLTENLKIKIIEHNSDKDLDRFDSSLDVEHIFNYSDINKDGIVVYEKKNIPSPTFVTVRIYMSDPECNDLLLREFETVLPRYNSLADHPVCSYDMFKDSDDCQKLVFYYADIDDEMEAIDYMTLKLREQEKNQNQQTEQKNKIDSRVIYVLAVIPVIIVVVIIVKGRGKHEKKNS